MNGSTDNTDDSLSTHFDYVPPGYYKCFKCGKTFPNYQYHSCDDWKHWHYTFPNDERIVTALERIADALEKIANAR